MNHNACWKKERKRHRGESCWHWSIFYVWCCAEIEKTSGRLSAAIVYQWKWHTKREMAAKLSKKIDSCLNKIFSQLIFLKQKKLVIVLWQVMESLTFSCSSLSRWCDKSSWWWRKRCQVQSADQEQSIWHRFAIICQFQRSPWWCW